METGRVQLRPRVVNGFGIEKRCFLDGGGRAVAFEALEKAALVARVTRARRADAP